MIGSLKFGLIGSRFITALDPYFNLNLVQLDGSGVASGTSFPNLASSGITATANGNAQTDGIGNILLDGTGDYLALIDTSLLDIGSDDFAVECDVTFDALYAFNTIFSSHYSGSTEGYIFSVISTGHLMFYDGTTQTDASILPLSVGVKYNLKFRSSSGTVNCYVDDVLAISVAHAPLSRAPLAQIPDIGRFANRSDSHINGTIDNIVITTGTDRVATFTKPVAGWSATVQCEAWARRTKTAWRVGGPGTYGKIRYEVGVSSGKKYWEVRVNAGVGNFHTGAVNSSWTAPTANGLGYDANAFAVISAGNTYTNSVTGSSVMSAMSDGSVIGVVVDGDTGKIWFSKDGVWSGDPSAGTGEALTMTGTEWFPAIYHAFAGQNSTIRTTSEEFTYTPPTGTTGLED